MFWQKKWGILIKEESESLDFIGLKIPRDYSGNTKEDRKETSVLGEVFHEPSTATSRPERERVRRVFLLE